MINEPLIEFIKLELSKGIDPLTVRTMLTSQGWTSAEIDRSFAYIDSGQTSSMGPVPKRRTRMKFVYGLLIVTLVGAGAATIIAQKATESVVEADVVEAPVKHTYTYTNHGFSIELPRGFVPVEEQAEGGPYTIISLPKEDPQHGDMVYIQDVSWWRKYDEKEYTFIGTETIGNTEFRKYKTVGDSVIYVFIEGNIGYYFGDTDRRYLETFKFVGWPSTDNEVTSLDLSDTYTNQYRAVFAAALEKPADFDQHYVVASYGCGSGCVQYSVVDKNTGRAYKGPADDYGGNIKTSVNFEATRYNIENDTFKAIEYSGIKIYKFQNGVFTVVK